MNKNQRKNRPRKKEVPQKTWNNTFENIKRQFEHGGRQEEN
jgi:hypothetical protein